MRLKCIKLLLDGSNCPNDARIDGNYCAIHTPHVAHTRRGKRYQTRKAPTRAAKKK